MPPRTNGYAAIGPFKSLERLALFHEEKARIARQALELLAEHKQNGKNRHAGGLMAQAIAIDHARAAARPKPRRPTDGDSIKAQRARTAALLDTFDTSTPKPGVGRPMAVLQQHGYIRRKGSGYVRTAKPFRI